MSYPASNYGLNYTSTIRSKDNYLYTFNVYKADYSGDVYEIPTANDPFIHDYLTDVDDPAQPIVTSTLTVNYDMTGIQFAPPEIDTDYEFLYYGELLDMNGAMLFRGWMLTDGVQVPFTSGLQFISIKFIDGLTLLRDITYESPLEIGAQSNTPNELDSLLTVFTTCLNSIEYHNSYQLGVMLRLFSAGMVTVDETMLPQSYLTYRSLQEKSCFEVLENILLALGCQLFQSEGRFWICSLVERPKDAAPYVLYDNVGNFIQAGFRAMQYKLKAYSDGTKDLYFVNNEQFKLIRKGYSNIELNYRNQFINIVPNKDYSSVVGGIPEWWNVSGTTPPTLTFEDVASYKMMRLVATTTPGDIIAQPSFAPNNFINSLNSVRVSFAYKWNSTVPGSGTLGTVRIVAIEEISPTSFRSWYWAASGYWIASGVTSSPFTINDIPRNSESIFLQYNNSDLNNFSIQTSPLPTPNPARLFVGVKAEYGSGLDSTDFSIGNFEVLVDSTTESIKNKIGTGGIWKYSKDLEIGIHDVDANSVVSTASQGALSDDDGIALTSFEVPEKTPSTYGTLGNYLLNVYNSLLNTSWVTFQGRLESLQVIRYGVDSNPCLPTNINVESTNNLDGTTTYEFTFVPPTSVDVTALTIQYRLSTSSIWLSNTGGNNSPRNVTLPNGSYVFRIRSIGGSCANQQTPEFTTSLVDVPSVVGPFTYLCHVLADDDTAKPYEVNDRKFVPTQLTINYKDSSMSGTFIPTSELDSPPITAIVEVKNKRITNG